jgi:hypothetical protein
MNAQKNNMGINNYIIACLYSPTEIFFKKVSKYYISYTVESMRTAFNL